MRSEMCFLWAALGNRAWVNEIWYAATFSHSKRSINRQLFLTQSTNSSTFFRVLLSNFDASQFFSILLHSDGRRGCSGENSINNVTGERSSLLKSNFWIIQRKFSRNNVDTNAIDKQILMELLIINYWTLHNADLCCPSRPALHLNW